ncbi:hypothetical protein GCM10010358_16050 [Streptomyces minutiscleroticus]|uniref:Uncharacterized protein n=1 Tax=Streptomyces minutiscleroticus TaxID=68238 RepID=A0A918KGV7_9ACTN|nr:hypothetical protein GCM10010358_16050 [Streptomyces minutiscleroticus]
MCARQLTMGSPKTRTGMPRARRWAAVDRPNGPAPITATGWFTKSLPQDAAASLRGGGLICWWSADEACET